MPVAPCEEVLVGVYDEERIGRSFQGSGTNNKGASFGAIVVKSSEGKQNFTRGGLNSSEPALA